MKITLIGAGGIVFTTSFITDILLNENLRGCEISLMDIHEGRVMKSAEMAREIASAIGIEACINSTTDLDKALEGADYVITVFRCGTIEHQRIEYEIPMKYGVDQVVGDTVGPGGIFRGLRTLNELFVVLEIMERVCPGAYLFNYVNPMSMNTIALNQRAETVKIVGLCHSVPHTAKQLSDYLAVSLENLRYLVAGVNHQAFFLKLEADGEDLYPKLRQAMDDPEVYTKDKVRFELLRHFGYFSTESSGHASEYIPYIRKRSDLIEKFCSLDSNAGMLYNMSAGMSGAALKIGEERLTGESRVGLDDLKQENLQASDEYAVKIIDAIENDKPMSANLNVMNDGLISNLPPNCSVEISCEIDGGGIVPQRVENYPEQLAGLNRGMINVQLLGATGALECDRKKIFQAIALDPLTAAVCSLNEVREMTNGMFETFKKDIDKRFFKL